MQGWSMGCFTCFPSHLCPSGLSIPKADGSKYDSRHRILCSLRREASYRNDGGTSDLLRTRTPLWPLTRLISLLVSRLESPQQAPGRWPSGPQPEHGLADTARDAQSLPSFSPLQGPDLRSRWKQQLLPRGPSTGLEGQDYAANMQRREVAARFPRILQAAAHSSGVAPPEPAAGVCVQGRVSRSGDDPA